MKKNKILDLKKAKKTVSEISREMGRSRTAITNFLKNPELYGTKKHTGRPKKVGKKQGSV